MPVESLHIHMFSFALLIPAGKFGRQRMRKSRSRAGRLQRPLETSEPASGPGSPAVSRSIRSPCWRKGGKENIANPGWRGMGAAAAAAAAAGRSISPRQKRAHREIIKRTAGLLSDAWLPFVRQESGLSGNRVFRNGARKRAISFLEIYGSGIATQLNNPVWYRHLVYTPEISR